MMMRGSWPEPSPDDLFLLSLQLDRQVIGDDVEAYVHGNGIVLPLGEICRRLELSVTVFPETGTATGFLIHEHSRFELDFRKQTVSVSGKSEAVDPALVEVHHNDIYVDSRLLSAWLPAAFDIDKNGAVARVSSRERLPVQERSRERRGGHSNRHTPYANPQFPILANPYRLWSFPTVDQSLESLGLPAPRERQRPSVYLLLGVAGGYAHFKRDRYSFNFFGPLMFTITLALIFYMNFKYGYSQSPELGNSVPREVRDRDYFYLWGFSAWSVWAGLGIVLLWDQLASLLSPAAEGDASRIPRKSWLMTTPVFLLAIVPLITNWSSASRHGDTFTRDWATDLLNSVEPYGVLITNGDNDTFPLWYAQEVEGVRKDVTVAVTSLLRTDWYVRQMIRRPIYPYDAAKGPLVYRGRSWPLPKGPPVDLTTEQADALPEAMSLPQAQMFKKDDIEAVIPAGDFFKDQIIVLRVIKDSYPNRPLYFTSGTYPRSLGLGKYVANQGLVAKLFPTPIVADKRFLEIPGYGFFDLPRTDSLWAMYKAPEALIRRGQWVDRASSDIPLRYIITAALLSDLTKAAGDSAKGAKYLGTAMQMARAARLESVLGFTKDAPTGTDGPERH